MSKILVCDDDQSILEVISIILEQNKYQVKTLSSGKAIKKNIDIFKPDLIFLDLWMPGIEGSEITQLLKRDEKTRSIPIIIISALNDTEKIAKKYGADGFLTKPFNMADLVKTVEKFVQTG